MAADADYQLTRRMELGTATRWDYAAIDSERHRLFLTQGDHVTVVEIPSGAVVGAIPNTQGVHGVAFAQDLKLGFISNGKSNSVTVFELETLKTIADVAVTGKNPDAILYEPSVRRVYIFTGGSATVDILDASTLKMVATVKATGRPEFAVSDGRGRIFFNVEDKGEIDVLDVADNQLSATWRLEGCTEPSGLAIDAGKARLFSVCSNGIMAVTDAKTGARVTQFPIGAHPDAAIYDPDTHTVLASCGGGSGTLTVARQDDADHYTILAQLVTEKGAKTMAMDPKDKEVYLPTVVGDKFIVLVASRRN